MAPSADARESAVDNVAELINYDAVGDIDPISLLHFYDSFIQDGQIGFYKIIFEEFGFTSIRFGKFARRLSWFSNSLKLPRLDKRQLNRRGLASYAVGLAEYLSAYHAARLRYGRLNSALNPISYANQMRPFIENILAVTYQVTGALDPKGVPWRFPINLNVVGAGLFALGLGPSPIQLYRPTRAQGANFNSGESDVAKMGTIFSAKAGAHWALSRAFFLIRGGLIAANVLLLSNTISTIASIYEANFNFGQMARAVTTPPADIRQETLEMIQENREDLAFFESKLAKTSDPSERERLQANIRAVSATLAIYERQLTKQEKSFLAKQN